MSSIHQIRHLVIPMAGRSEDPTLRYWPLMPVGDRPIVARAVDSFRSWMPPIEQVTFVILREHEERWSVTATLEKLFPELPIRVLQLAAPTDGPAQTVLSAIRAESLEGSLVVSDVDHAVKVDPVLERFTNDASLDGVVPLWDLRGEDVKRWAVAVVQRNGRITGIAEKRLPSGTGSFMGVIGCYAFPDAAELAADTERTGSRWLSEVLAHRLTAGKTIVGVTVDAADLYGDIQHLRQARARRALFSGTVFCDLDGTLTYHDDEARMDAQLREIAGSGDAVRTWADQGYEIVIATARPQAQEGWIASELERLGIPFHRVVAGLPSGPRVVINDRKPSAILNPQASAVELERDQGVSGVRLSHPKLHVLARFTGGSVAETLLVEDNERMFVRKRVTKRIDLSMGYNRLRAQARSLERFDKLCPGLVPELYRESDDPFEYFFDLEYLPEHRLLSALDSDEQFRCVARLVDTLAARVYRHDLERAPNTDWLLAHLSTKVHAKANTFLSVPALKPLMTADKVVVNDREIPSIPCLLRRIEENASLLEYLAPRRITTVHGDLTFENVLVDGDDIRLIDMDGAEFLDAPELDLGKLYQSAVAGYEQWAHVQEAAVTLVTDGEFTIHPPKQAPIRILDGTAGDTWQAVLACSRDAVHRKGIFFMGLHLLRMVPFRIRISIDHALFAALLGLQYLEWASAPVDRDLDGRVIIGGTAT